MGEDDPVGGRPVAPGPLSQRQWDPSSLVPAVTAGLLIGLLEVVVATSFGSLVFRGELAGHVSAGIGLALFGGAAILSVTAVRSSLPGMIGSVQDSSTAILALVAAGIAASLPVGDPRVLPTVVAAIAVATAATGIGFLLLGLFRLGGLVRYVPYPVIGGFLAGTGWLLVRGGIDLLAGRSVSLSTLPVLLEPGVAARWLPGAALAVLFLVLLRRSSGPLTLPAALVGAIGVFYAAVLLIGTPLGEVERAGWLLGPFPPGGLWPPLSAASLAEVSWGSLAAQLPNVATLIGIAVVALLLGASGIELVTDQDLDLDHELRAAGLANLVAGLGGGLAGYQALSLTALGDRMRGRSRLTGLVAAGVCVAVLLFGGSLLAAFPAAVAGALVLFLGLEFLDEWLVRAWWRLSGVDYAVVVLILVTVAAVGFVEGIALGLVAAVVLFAVNYARLDPVKHELTGATYHSHVDRPPEHREALRSSGAAIWILELQGFLFFGTAGQLLERVRARVDRGGGEAVRFVVLDLRRTPAIDASAAHSFVRLGRLVASRGVELVLTGLAPGVEKRLIRGGGVDRDVLRVLPDLDRGVQWCEDRLLAAHGLALPAVDVPLLDWLPGDAERAALRRHLERLEVAGGTHLIRQGDASADIYLLESGRLTAVLETSDGELRLRTMAPGVVVGELGFYLGIPRTASVLSETPAVVHRLTRESLARIEQDQPALAAAIHRHMAGMVAERLAESLATIEALLE